MLRLVEPQERVQLPIAVWACEVGRAAADLYAHAESRERKTLRECIKHAEAQTRRRVCVRLVDGPPRRPEDALVALRSFGQQLEDSGEMYPRALGRLALVAANAASRDSRSEETRRWRLYVEWYRESDLPREPELSTAFRRALVAAGYWTRARLEECDDAEVLNIRGIGPKALAQIRAFRRDRTDDGSRERL